MNTRALYIVLAVQAFFAAALIFVGTRARDARKLEYLERTHRATSGQASEDDLARLAASLAPDADAPAVRALFGLPVSISRQIEVRDAKDSAKTQTRKGTFWIYYPWQPPQPPVDPASSAKLSGAQRCFVVEFDDAGSAKSQFAWILHPVQ